jgi:hypothetical protein
MTDVSKLTMKDGCSCSTDEHNPVLGSIMHKEVLAWMVKIQEGKDKAIDRDLPEKKTEEEEAGQCDFCSADSSNSVAHKSCCQWTTQRF